MPQNTHLELAAAEAKWQPASPQETTADLALLRTHAVDLARSLAWLPNTPSSHYFQERGAALATELRPLIAALRRPREEGHVSDDFRWLHDNVRLVNSELQDAGQTLKPLRKTPHVRDASHAVLPRVAAIAAGYLEAAGWQFAEETFAAYMEAFQEITVLNLRELWGLVPAMKLRLLAEIKARGAQLAVDHELANGVGVCVRSLRDIGQTSWKDLLEPLILFDRVLREDPTGTYARMEYDSRDLYRDKIVKIAERSDMTEMQVAAEALALAKTAQAQPDADPRMATRQSHIGYYLIAEGAPQLHQKVAYNPKFLHRVAMLLRKYPDDFFIPGIAILTLVIMSVTLLIVTDPWISLTSFLVAMLALLLLSSQSAVQMMAYLVTSSLRPQILPKFDFSKGVPNDCLSLVAVPSLLLSDKQVRRLVDDLEVRFLGNHDPNLYYALLTDLADAREPSREDDPLVELCSQLVRALNKKHGTDGKEPFLVLHRHRVYNPREKVWMGWERKRGKLLDLNKLLRNDHDSFPVKVGDLSILPKVRFVITLDADTELPRGAAQRMIGALAHPLNQGIIDPKKNIVVAGYGILQPRVGVSVQSATRSRLASIFSGETGFDIYTRAVSDVYQDLYGEGSFTGKGIYEVETIHRVLDRRFPRNALLSHDLIEGAYARAGLASDIEVIEDYPSHYSAYNKRKHRWLRGDWQIAGWLLPQVSEESGEITSNPISLLSQWKILDNLRRSLVEPATFMLFVLGWLALPGRPRSWTLAALVILIVPTWFQFGFSLVRAAVTRSSVVVRDALSALFAATVNVFMTLTFLAHQTLVSIDAVVRALVRRMLTRQRLLEWETAAEAELGNTKRSPADSYLNWVPVLSLLLAVIVLLTRRSVLPAALPILVLWASSKPLSVWLNRPPRSLRYQASERDELFLRRSALRTWRYFAEFCTEEHNWLIPDNVQEEPANIAARISPTNLGFLLNARQVACEFGYLTVPEFAQQTHRTLETVSRLPRYRGQFFNWYETRTLAPLGSPFVSSVDSGNLVASLWTLEQGSLERLHRPLLESTLATGFIDHLRILVDLGALPRKALAEIEREIHEENWLQMLLGTSDSFLQDIHQNALAKHLEEAKWFAEQALARLHNIGNMVRSYAPWLMQEFAPLWDDPALKLEFASHTLGLERVPGFIDKLSSHLKFVSGSSASEEHKELCRRLLSLLPEARSNAMALIGDLEAVAAIAHKFSNEMEFGFLLNRRRKLLSVGYDVESKQLSTACYDLLATESRTAVFTAIAKEDIPQESWFMLGRAHTIEGGRPVLLSWTGTMFEYLMPALWMRMYPNTLLERSRLAAVRLQQAYTANKGIPWGISESAFFQTDEAGNYQYYAFGLPHLAMRKREQNALVISPYSTFLALHVDAAGAVRNLRKMMKSGWFGAYGFYEAADYTPSRLRSRRHRYELVRCWMAHHQGMILLSVANFLQDNVVQSWFHNDPRVQATELLLHEKPVGHVRVSAEAG